MIRNPTSLGAVVADSQILANRYPYICLTFVVLLVNGIFYLPFLSNGTVDQLFRYWDGPNYLLVAKTLYSIPADHPLSPYTVPSYFAAHLPLYPFAIKLFSVFGYPVAMLLTTTAFTVGATLVFYTLLKENNWVSNPLWSTVISLFIPARYLIYHTVGATEAPFIFFICLSLLFYFRERYFLSFLFGGFAGITRITGILLGIGYLVDLLIKRRWKVIPLLGLIGSPLFLTFVFYHFHYGDFFAYLKVNASESNKLFRFDPFLILKSYASTGNTHAAEFYLYLYAVYGIGTALLWKVNRTLCWAIAPFFLFNCFVFHQDLARYFIPLAPFSLVIAFDKVLHTRAALWLFLPVVALTYIYAWGMIPHNLCVDWVYNNLDIFLE